MPRAVLLVNRHVLRPVILDRQLKLVPAGHLVGAHEDQLGVASVGGIRCTRRHEVQPAVVRVAELKHRDAVEHRLSGLLKIAAQTLECWRCILEPVRLVAERVDHEDRPGLRLCGILLGDDLCVQHHVSRPETHVERARRPLGLELVARVAQLRAERVPRFHQLLAARRADGGELEHRARCLRGVPVLEAEQSRSGVQSILVLDVNALGFQLLAQPLGERAGRFLRARGETPHHLKRCVVGKSRCPQVDERPQGRGLLFRRQRGDVLGRRRTGSHR